MTFFKNNIYDFFQTTTSPINYTPLSEVFGDKCDFLETHLKKFNFSQRHSTFPFKIDKFPFLSSNYCQNNSDNSQMDTEKSYIWNHLYELLGQNKSVIASSSFDSNRYNAVKKSMKATIKKIQFGEDGDNSSDEDDDSNTTETGTKRKLPSACKSDASACKLSRIDHEQNAVEQYFGSGSTNNFMVGNTFQRFQQIFDKINYIKVKKPESFDNQKSISEKISFDLWASRDHQEPQLKGPDFRLIVL